MLKFENVSLKYGSFLALDQVSLHAGQGEHTHEGNQHDHHGAKVSTNHDQNHG